MVKDKETVTIRVLEVNGRHVSFARFRQWPEKQIIDHENAQLIEVPFGWVNYRWGERLPEYRNFIVNSNGILFRCPVVMRNSDESLPSARGRFVPLNERHDPEWCRRWDTMMETLEKIEQVFIGS